ncbi:MAG: hypothetical protein Q8P50_06500 [Bacillota bacterium]|nr:hypothetical protein [Bacillota bacterium]
MEPPLCPDLTARYDRRDGLQRYILRKTKNSSLSRYSMLPSAIVVPFFLGTIYQCYVSGDAFIKPNFFGINLGRLLFVTLVWWGAIQTGMPLYIANRLAPRRWDRKPLSP